MPDLGGAALAARAAWEIADVPRHRAALPEPIGGFVPGVSFGIDCLAGARVAVEPGGAIGALARRWSVLHPPCAIALSGVDATPFEPLASGDPSGRAW